MELLIKNGTVVTAQETQKADLHIKNGKVIKIAPQIDIDGIKTIDASDKFVLPGGIDVHTHLDMPFMGAFSTDDFYTGTVAAAFGGTTSIIDYVIPQKNQSISEALNLWHGKAKDKAVIDYGFHLAVVPPIDKLLSELPLLSERGITSVKCFMAYKNALMLENDSLQKLLEAAAKYKILVCIHAESGDVIDVLTKKLISDGKTEPIFHAISRLPVLEGDSARQVLKLANISKTPVYFVHLSTENALNEIKKAKSAGQKVFSETCPQYFLLNQDRYFEPDFAGAKYVMSPPLREQKHLSAIIQAIEEDRIDTIATDHCPFNFNKEKQMGKMDFSKIPNGIPCIENRLQLCFHELVTKNKISINKFVELTSSKPAEIFGMTTKGDLKEGFDADIAIWDTEYAWTIKAENLHHNVDYSPFEGFCGKGKPITIISKGKIIVENNELKAKACEGKFIKREISKAAY
jgi:dihydropyrimidinase